MWNFGLRLLFISSFTHLFLMRFTSVGVESERNSPSMNLQRRRRHGTGTYAIYEQIVNQIKNQIISGELQPDEALPSIRGLAADIGVSVITTKHAYEELEREGLIRSVSNKGFYVCKYNTDYLHEKQLMELEKRLQEWITLAKQAGLGTEDIREMLEGLL